MPYLAFESLGVVVSQNPFRQCSTVLRKCFDVSKSSKDSGSLFRNAQEIQVVIFLRVKSVR